MTEVKIGNRELSEYGVFLKNSTPSGVTAFDALKKYLALTTGKSPEERERPPYIELQTGENCEDEEYTVRNDGEILRFYGGKRGIVYAVYDFLEKLGWRFFTPELEKNVCDKVELDESFSMSKKPLFCYRLPFYSWSENPDWMLKNRVNSMHMGKLSDEYGNSFDYAGPHFVHTFKILVNPKDYFETHPEYFSMNEKGEREAEGQLCLSNPALVDVVVPKVREWLLQNPNARVVSLSQNDNQEYCKCRKCALINAAEGSESGTLLRFVNKIATALKDEFPFVKFDTLAYQYTRRAPRLTVPADNVVIRLCTIECCRSHPISDENCEMNRNFRRDVEEWKKISDKIFIWDYVHNFSFHISPFPNFNTLWENVRFFAENNVKGVFVEGNHYGAVGEFEELRGYMIAKLLYNPLMSREEYDTYFDEFLLAYYGKGYKFIKEYIELIQDWSKDNHYNIYHEPYIILPNKYEWDSTIDRTRIEKSYELWDNALKLAEGDEINRVKKSALQVKYYDYFMTLENRLFKSDDEKESEKLLKDYLSLFEEINSFGIKKVRFNVGGQMVYKGSKYF